MMTREWDGTSRSARPYPDHRSGIALLLVLALIGCGGGGGGGGAANPGGGVVTITVSTTGTPAPGNGIMADAVITLGDGSTLVSITWSQTEGAPTMIASGAAASTGVTLPDLATLKARLIDVLKNPPVTAAQLPPNVPLTGNFHGGLQDRFQVVGINPWSLETTGLVKLEVTVETTSGTYTEELEIHLEMPWVRSPALENVPVGRNVLMQGKTQATYDWVLTTPVGSVTVLADANTQNPEFTPDIPGLYQLTVTDLAAASMVTLDIYAGHWRGIIVGQDMNGHPVADSACTVCHNGTIAPDKFTSWAQTGHAEIFTDNLNSSPYYNSSCFVCHSVGHDVLVANNGFDDQTDFGDFMASGLVGTPGNNWTTMLTAYPHAAQMANVQCENCHGPQDSLPGQPSAAHGASGPTTHPRHSLSSDVCATCHGEPLRHARFQQWQLSGHANYDLAISRSQSGSCARCHTANGFLEWLPILTGDVPGDPTASVSVSWTADEAHPQTCQTCHDPHAAGNTSGSNSNATVRISGDTPPLIAGFTAVAVGRGAICMTCHNSRRGLRNDLVYPGLSLSDRTRAPHGSAQTDVLMGENAYFVNTGVRGAHSFLVDTCVTCHMEATPPPSVLSYNQGGTNHTFFAATTICAECHTSNISAASVQTAVETKAHMLQDFIETAIITLMDGLIIGGASIDLDGQATITNVSEITELVFGESSGRQAITVTLTNGMTYGPLRVTNVDIVQPPAAPAQLYSAADDRLIKAGWNWALIHNDGSKGVHNPTYALSTLDTAIDEVKVLLGL